MLLLLLAFPASVSASQDFYVRHVVDYKFDTAGRSTVVNHISLTNKIANYYADRYEMELVGENPQHISGRDAAGPLKITATTPAPNTTRLVTRFNTPVTGLDKTLNFTIQYQGRTAVRKGQVWEVPLPKFSNSSALDDYSLNLIVPPTFGQPAYLSPPPASSAGHSYVFTKDQLTQGIGVSGAFGNFQTLSFRLKYRLENSSVIPLPADSAYQKIFFDSITPPPDSVTIDPDGNWLASFTAGDITVTGQAHILIDPLTTFADAPPEKYLSPTAYWPSTDPQIINLAKSLKTPRKIYDYVVQNVNYEYSAERKGALTALSSGKGVCTEFTDLFIAIARAAGIPAREVNGYGYTTDPGMQTPIHSWPQYWDSARRIWVSVDPTWGKTSGGVDYFSKLDFNHLAFITRGLSDSQPSVTTTDIQVSYTSYRDFPALPVTAKWQPPLILIPYIPVFFKLHLTNPNSQALYNNPVTLPPYGSTTLTTQFTLTQPFDFTPRSVSLLNMPYNIPATLFLPWQLGFAILISLTIISGGIYFQKLLRNRHLRR